MGVMPWRALFPSMIVARSLCRVLLHQRREVLGNLPLSSFFLWISRERLLPAEHAYRRPQQTHWY
jgi:hypothetical protein